jgi:hypothetical protein
MSSALGAYAPNHHLTVYEPYRARYGQAPGNATYDQPGCERYGTPTVPVRYPIYERLFHPAQQTQSRASYLPPRPMFGGSMPPPAVFNEPWAKENDEPGSFYCWGQQYLFEYEGPVPKQPPTPRTECTKPLDYYTQSKL